MPLIAFHGIPLLTPAFAAPPDLGTLFLTLLCSTALRPDKDGALVGCKQPWGASLGSSLGDPCGWVAPCPLSQFLHLENLKRGNTHPGAVTPWAGSGDAEGVSPGHDQDTYSPLQWPFAPSSPLPSLSQPCSTYPSALGDADELIQVGLVLSAGALRGHGAPASAVTLLLAPVQGPGEA